MPKPAQTVTVETTEEVVLEPSVRRKLQTKLLKYKEQLAVVNAAKEKLDLLKLELGAIQSDSGGMTVALEGYGRVTLVAGTQKRFNKKKFIQLGGDIGLYNEAMEEKPKKPFIKVTLPGDRESESDE